MKQAKWRLYEVVIEWGPHSSTSELSARSSSHARYQAWQSFSDAWPCTFRQFMPLVKVRRIAASDCDGYDYVRRAYGVDPRIGQQIELVNEGDWSGKRGEIVHPGSRSTASIHVAFPGISHALSVHPNNYRVAGASQ